jgi:hypothetical protein
MGGGFGVRCLMLMPLLPQIFSFHPGVFPVSMVFRFLYVFSCSF